MPNEMSPLLQGQPGGRVNKDDLHSQFCSLVGVPSSVATPEEQAEAQKLAHGRKVSQLLYDRALQKVKTQRRVYMLTASISNTLLLSQVILGAALTALGASASSHVLITVFGALNTVIAGVVAYLKSRGQPMRARMFRDDLNRVIDEIENSEIMFLGISRDAHGYDEIDVENEVSVRSEVARLTRLYDRAIKNSTMNDPDMYMAGSNAVPTTGLRARPGQPLPVVSAAPGANAAAPAPLTGNPADESPATARPKEDDADSPATDDTATPAKPTDQSNKGDSSTAPSTVKGSSSPGGSLSSGKDTLKSASKGS